MHAIASLLVKVLSRKLTQQLIVLGLETVAKRSDNTVDDKVVQIVKHGLANRLNPIKRVAP
ncbi:MAG: hypothetical protein JL55_18960 [Pseudomonas sp. BICA1-14]|nr:hypothetical protein [[Pseudomonas] sp. BICA1-14]KJS76247.1 MAG: hypothetical protein JL55_18960 [[Pseudomonas] sp. BICA1-14]HBW09469.1 hypothetical protein [Pseudomonas sp.]